MKTIADFNFNGLKALVRVDFNVPLNDNFEITDDTRINAALPTIRKIMDDGGQVILMSHLGRPKSGSEEKFSLKHIVATLFEKLNVPITFIDDCLNAKAQIDATPINNVVLLENLRFYAEEQAGDEAFAKQLSTYADVYVNDAFGTAHRAHASTSIIAQFFDAAKKMAGRLLASEVDNANKVMKNAENPLTIILGGAKVSGKIMIIENLMATADNIIIGGGMAYTFFKAKGGNIGNSLLEEDRISTALEVMELAEKNNTNLLLPEDSIVADAFSNTAKTQVANNMEIPNDWMGLDIGPKAIEAFTQVIEQSKTLLWNGPMGVFELSSFQKGTKAIAQAVANATQNGAFSLVGGGDSVAAVNQFGYNDKVSFVSTGGGALLELFEGKQLPGIGALA